MRTRIDFHKLLESTTGLKRIYYQPPKTHVLEYPCIVYSREDRDSRPADDLKYLRNTRWIVTYMTMVPDDPLVEKILDLPYSRFDRELVVDRVYNHVVTIHF